MIVTISPTWLAPFLRQFKGKIIYRTYGQSFSLTEEFSRLGIADNAQKNQEFYFLPHAKEALNQEANWLKNRSTPVGYCLPDDVFGYTKSWAPEVEKTKLEIGLSCPNISNPYYQQHYNDVIKKHFSASHFKIFGVQLSKIDDEAVVGTISRSSLLERFRRLACFVYTYDDPQVCYLPPIEAMVIGVPVLFPKGCLLDKYFGQNESPGCYSSFSECESHIDRILSGDNKFIEKIIYAQSDIVRRYKPSDVWPDFDREMISILNPSLGER